MPTRTTTSAAVAVLALLTGCSSGGDDRPAEPSSSTSAAADQAAREACVKAWANAFAADPDVKESDEPAACKDAPGPKLTMYADGLKLKLERGREELAECMDDPDCAATWGADAP